MKTSPDLFSKLRWLVLLAILLPLNHSAAADCDLKLEVTNTEWTGGARGGYGIFEPDEVPQIVRFRVRLAGGDPCLFFVTVGGVAQGNVQRRAANAGETLNYNVYDSLGGRTALKDLPSANASEVLHGTFAPGETVKEMECVIVVPPLQNKRPGRYTDVLRITLYQGTLENFVQKDSKTTTFSVIVDPVAALSIVNAGAAFDPSGKSQTMDFGALAKGKAKGFDLRVRGNVGYHVTLESENGGVLKNIDPQYKDVIPYVLETGGKPVNLNSGRQTPISRSQRLTGHNGDRHAVVITIGDTSKATAGTYRDHIQITVISDD